MVDIIIGEEVINKSKEIGTIVSFENIRQYCPKPHDKI